MNLWLVLIAIALIVASGLLIAAETAMTRVSKTRIDELRKEGNGNEKRAELLLGVLQDRARYVNVLFLLSTIATITSITLISYCLLYTSPSPRDRQKSRMPSSA